MITRSKHYQSIRSATWIALLDSLNPSASASASGSASGSASLYYSDLLLLPMGRYHPNRLLFAALVLLLIYVHVRHSRDDEFYNKTVKALNRKARDKAWKDETDAKAQQILKDKISPPMATSMAILQPAATPPSGSGPRLPPNRSPPLTQPLDDDANDKDNGEGITGPKSPPGDQANYTEDPSISATSPLSSKPTSMSDPAYLAKVRAALDEIIHHRSIVIFSKTHCPHSRRAKSILLETYDIVPKPHVVELDTLTEPLEDDGDSNEKEGKARGGERPGVLTMGRALQDLLAQRTGRKTVPNIMVLGMSIGGADEVVTLHEQAALADKLKGMIGKRLERCERRRPKSDEVGREGGHGAL